MFLKLKLLFSMLFIFNNYYYFCSRIERINELKSFLKEDKKFEEKTIKHLKTRGDMYVLLR